MGVPMGVPGCVYLPVTRRLQDTVHVAHVDWVSHCVSVGVPTGVSMCGCANGCSWVYQSVCVYLWEFLGVSVCGCAYGRSWVYLCGCIYGNSWVYQCVGVPMGVSVFGCTYGCVYLPVAHADCVSQCVYPWELLGVSVLVYQWVFLGVCIYLPHMYSACRTQFM